MFMWALCISGLAAAIFYKKSKDPGFSVMKGADDAGKPPRSSSKP